ncbi:DUF6602 domain-containing protein [Agrobacterium sp. 22-222-1]
MKAVLNAVLDGKIKSFRNEFIDHARDVFFQDGETFHTGEFGLHREKLVRRFLRSFVPHRLAISTGFVVNSENSIATQADVVIFDSAQSPLIESDNDQLFFAAEAACAIGEVKSFQSKSELRETLRKLSAQKQIKHLAWTGPGSRVGSISNEKQLITFVICEEIRNSKGEGISPDEINNAVLRAYEEATPPTPAELRHNLVLSLKQGLGVYSQEGISPTLRAVPYFGAPNQFMWVAPSEPNGTDHITLFCALLFDLTHKAETFTPPLLKYMATPRVSYSHGVQLNVSDPIEARHPEVIKRKFEFTDSNDVTILGANHDATS